MAAYVWLHAAPEPQFCYIIFFWVFTEVGITCIPRLPRLSWFRTKKYSMACFEGMWGIETQIHIPQRAWCMKVVKN
jgi:hypothetical protein